MSANAKRQHLVRTESLRKNSAESINNADALAQLQADRENHLRELERLKTALLDMPEASIEEGDPAVAEQVQTRAQVNRVTEHLRELDRAIEAAQHADYAICETCGKPIDPERLRILPETRVCVQCKRKLEKFALPRFRS